MPLQNLTSGKCFAASCANRARILQDARRIAAKLRLPCKTLAKCCAATLLAFLLAVRRNFAQSLIKKPFWQEFPSRRAAPVDQAEAKELSRGQSCWAWQPLYRGQRAISQTIPAHEEQPARNANALYPQLVQSSRALSPAAARQCSAFPSARQLCLRTRMVVGGL